MAIVLMVNTVLLIFFTCASAFLLAGSIDFRKTLYAGIERLNREYNEKRLRREFRRYGRNIPFRMSFVERIELYLIDKSNIRHFLPFMNFYALALLCFTIFASAFWIVYNILFFVPSALIISLMFALIPVFILDIMGRYNSEKIRGKLAEFISVLNRWCAIKEDIFYAFEKSIDSNIGMPLKVFVRDMVIQVDRGINPMEAIEILMLKVGDPQFRDFIANIKQNIRHRGDTQRLLANLENQFYKIDEEYNRRRISTYKDRLLTYIVMFLVIFVGYFFIRTNPAVREFYLNTLEGKSYLMLFCMLYACGLGLTNMSRA